MPVTREELDAEVRKLRDEIRGMSPPHHAQTHRAGGGDPMPFVAGGGVGASTADLFLVISPIGSSADLTRARVFAVTAAEFALADGGPLGTYTLSLQVGAKSHTFMAVVDSTTASTTVPYVVVPVPAAGTIIALEAVCGDNITCGATSAIFDVHKILAANVNTDGQGTTLFTTQANRPTIVNGAKKSTTTLPDVLTVAAGDYLAFYTDQQGTNLTVATIGVRMTMP